jgi:hypothetical protein
MPSSSIHPVIKIISFLVLRMLLSSAGIGTHFIIFVFVIMPFIFIFIGFKAVAFLEGWERLDLGFEARVGEAFYDTLFQKCKRRSVLGAVEERERGREKELAEGCENKKENIPPP